LKTRTFAFLLTAAIMFTFFTACGGSTSASPTPTPAPITLDRDGNPIALPSSIDTILVIGPSNAEILVALGFGDRIIGADDFSCMVEGVPSGIPEFSMWGLNGELMIDLEPDVIFMTGMMSTSGDDALGMVAAAGICIVYIPNSSSIQGIREDIAFIAAVMGTQEKGRQIVADMDREIEAIRAIGSTVADKKTVYFELDAFAPMLYSIGSGSFIHEMIEIIGAVNVFDGQQDAWLAIAEEAVLDANPDVILTNNSFLDDPISIITSRPGWNVLSAVSNDEVYFIDADSSSRPTHNIVTALRQMAQAVYPGLY